MGHEIKFYKKENCPACVAARHYISECGLPNGWYITELDAEAHLDFLHLAGATAAPVIIFPGGNLITGWGKTQKETFNRVISITRELQEN